MKNIHFKALIFTIFYIIISGIIFLNFVSVKNLYISFLGPIFFGIISGIIFLYLFSHKDFFPFMERFEKEKNKTERGYLSKFKHYGKILACIAISEVGGPIFLALSVRLLFPKTSNRYLIVIGSTIISTLFAVALARGLLSFLW